MSGSLTIGDFSRATFLSVKTLRHYHRVGLLEPNDVDPGTGYRRYSLAETQRAVASLRDLLEHPPPPAAIEHRRVPATPAAAIAATLDVGDLAPWFQGAVGEIHATLSAQGIAPGGPAGGIYANELFSEERDEATVYLPVDGEVRPVGRVGSFIAPSIELAVITHIGSHADVDRSYGEDAHVRLPRPAH